MGCWWKMFGKNAFHLCFFVLRNDFVFFSVQGLIRVFNKNNGSMRKISKFSDRNSNHNQMAVKQVEFDTRKMFEIFSKKCSQNFYWFVSVFQELSIFDKCQFYLYGQFHTYKKEDLADLIKITGAPLLKREPKLHRIDSDSDVNNSHSTSTVYIIYEVKTKLHIEIFRRKSLKLLFFFYFKSTIPDVLLDTNRLKHIKLLDFLACIDYYETQGRLDQ